MVSAAGASALHTLGCDVAVGELLDQAAVNAQFLGQPVMCGVETVDPIVERAQVVVRALDFLVQLGEQPIGDVVFGQRRRGLLLEPHVLVARAVMLSG